MGDLAFVGRQSIVDRDRRVVAYEILYRRGSASAVADYDDQSVAAVRVMANTFASLGEEAVLGGMQGYFNVTREVLLSDAVYALPKERVVIELLEQIEADREVLARCRALREAGYAIALDDFVLDDPRTELLACADLVKVELPAVTPRDLRRLARGLRDEGLRTLAEKVETQPEFEACLKAGFDLFQGYFFARPAIIEGALVDPAQSTLLRLLQQVSGGADTAAIVESFKQDAKLGVNLIRLVNTAGRATRVALESIEDGVRHLGLTQLTRWLTVLLFAQGRRAGVRDPLLTLAAHRGRLMELVVRTAGKGHLRALDPEHAFLAGMLSLVDALLGRPLEAIAADLRLGPELSGALLRREGELGHLLRLAEASERGDVDRLAPELEHFSLGIEELQAQEHAAYAWIHALQRSLAA